MDPRYPSQPFSHPQLQQAIQDQRYGPITPSPFGSQPPAPRPETLHKNDPFLRRRNDLEEPRQSPSLNNAPNSYMLPQTSRYTNSIPISQSAPSSDGHLRRSSFGGAGLWADGRGDRLAIHTSEDSRDRPMQHSIPTAPPPLGYGTSHQAGPVHQDAQHRPTSQAGSSSLFSVPDHYPTPLFTGRQMLPPSPHASQAQQHQQPTPMRIPTTKSSSNCRELPAPSSTHRPSSSMSISSMLDSNPAKSSRDSVPDGNSNGNVRTSATPGFLGSPTHRPGQAASPPGVEQRQSLFSQKSKSPNKSYHAQTGRPFRSFSGGLEQRPPSFAQPKSPETARNGSLSGSQTSQHSPSSGLGSHRSWMNNEGRRLPDGRVVSRPSSQPTGHRSPPRDPGGRSMFRDPVSIHSDSKSAFSECDRVGNNEGHIATSGNALERAQPQLRAFPDSEEISTHSVAHSTPIQERSNGSGPSLFSRPLYVSESNQGQPIPEQRPEVGQTYEFSQPSGPTQSPFSPEILRRLQKERQGLHQRIPGQSPSKYARAVNGADERLKNTASFPDHEAMSKEVDLIDPPHFRDDTNGHRKSSLAMLMENNRREGRFSPLPQAVQGAQGRTNGPASDPGIKNEFARMFSGIGSGVGSAGPNGSGTSTPFAPPSPTISHEQRPTPFASRGELGLAKPATTSRGGKRSRKVKDGEPRAGLVHGDASISGTKSGKRSRQNHFHPYHVHHRHHNHHAAEGDMNNGTTTPTVTNAKRLTTSLQPSSSAAPHRHHHHTAIHHHKHHEPRPQPLPTTTINNEALLNSVRLRPRDHLGSTVYRSSLEPATFDASRFGYASTPYPLPRHEGKENCTYTVRVPKFHLSPQEREEVCRRRALWGTDVYTDDSDPLAAAIHSGWVRGDYGEDIDIAMLEPPSDAKTENRSPETKANPQGAITSLPTEPMLPPSRKDLNLTLLVLPALEKYASHIAHGIKSRDWGDTHDGMSFKILSMEWVDGQGEERSGKGRRNRMKRSQAQATSKGPAIQPYGGNLSINGGGGLEGAAVAVGA